MVLAGGRSTRFGEPKQLYKIAGREMIDWVLSSAKSTGADIIVSIKRGNEYLLPLIEKYSATPVYDDVEQYSPLVGLCSAAKACKHEAIIVVPSDSPFITPKFFLRLFNSLQGLDVSAVIPVHHDGRIEAIHAAYRRSSLLVACKEAMEKMDLSVRSLPFYLPSVYFTPVEEMEKEEVISIYDFDEKNELLEFKLNEDQNGP